MPRALPALSAAQGLLRLSGAAAIPAAGSGNILSPYPAVTILAGCTLLWVHVLCPRLCECCSFAVEIRFKMGKDMRKQCQLFGSCTGSPNHSEFALRTKRPRLCMTLATGTGSFFQFHAGKNLVGAGRGHLLSPVPLLSPVEGEEDVQDDRNISSVTGGQLCSYKVWGKRLGKGLGRVTGQKTCLSCRGSSRLLGPAAVKRVRR